MGRACCRAYILLVASERSDDPKTGKFGSRKSTPMTERGRSCARPQLLASMEGAMKLSFKSTATLLALSVVVLSGVPALAARTADPANCSLSLQHKAVACSGTIFGTCIKKAPDAQLRNAQKAPHDDWPANMILDNFQTSAGARKLLPIYAI
jgi:hypothetical protein